MLKELIAFGVLIYLLTKNLLTGGVLRFRFCHKNVAQPRSEKVLGHGPTSGGDMDRCGHGDMVRPRV